MNQKKSQPTLLYIILALSILLNLILGFIALDRTIRVNELVGTDDWYTEPTNNRPTSAPTAQSYPLL